MRMKVIGLVFTMIFVITGVALAGPKLEALPTLSEPALMFLLGLFLTGASFLGRKIYAEQRIDRDR